MSNALKTKLDNFIEVSGIEEHHTEMLYGIVNEYLNERKDHHQNMRKQLWADVASSVASSSASNSSSMTKWANETLSEFDAKFASN